MAQHDYKVNVGLDDKELQSGLAAATKKSAEFKKSMESLNFAAFSQGLKNMSSSLSSLVSSMGGLVDAYAVQEEAETKLQTVMKQRMNASEEEIQSIKDLASAQQSLGIIGDEVQLAGVQQVATFLNEKSSIETLLPAMNNLLAQQKGFNATSSDAVNIGNLVGKVMQGQVGALTKVGITFTKAEEQVLKYGNESQRAAMLAQVITNNVGEMNAALAATDSGKQKQLDNTLGDIKEQIGGLVKGAMPFVTLSSQVLMAATSLVTLVEGMKSFNIVQGITNALMAANPIGIVVLALGGLATALRIAYVNSEDFRNICDKCWAAVKPLAIAIKNGLVATFEKFCYWASAAWKWLKQILGLDGEEVEVKAVVTTSGDLDLGEEPIVPDKNNKKQKTIKPKEPVVGLIGLKEEEISKIQKKIKEATNIQDIRIFSEELRKAKEELEALQKAGDKLEMPNILPKKESIIGKGLTAEGLKLKPLQNYNGELEKISSTAEKAKGVLGSIGEMMSNLSGVVGECAAAWLQWGANLMQAIAKAIPYIMSLIGVEEAEKTASSEAAMTKGASSVAGIPIVGPVLAVAAIASIAAALLSMPKFADGGIISGPTIGLMGEYAGASNNPEVVAPLNKLRSILEPNEFGGGQVEFKIEGRTLVGILSKENNRTRRS